MGNPLPLNVCRGTIGELFVQLKLLELGVQAAPPLKDSGNDLIAIRGEVARYIQVKTERRARNLPDVYHLLFIVDLKKDSQGNYLYDQSKIWVTSKGQNLNSLRELTNNLVDELWS